jgi:hypothetical protein
VNYFEAMKRAHEKYQKWRSCLSKRKYPSKAAAEDPGSRVYKCRHCGMFHRATKKKGRT